MRRAPLLAVMTTFMLMATACGSQLEGSAGAPVVEGEAGQSGGAPNAAELGRPVTEGSELDGPRVTEPSGTGPAGGTSGGAGTPSGTSGATGSGTTSDGDQSGSSTAGGSDGTAPSTPDEPVAEEPIRIAFGVADTTGFGAVSGTDYSEYQDSNSEEFQDAQERDFQLLVEWANETGGVGGRPIEAVPIRYLVTDVTSPDRMVAHCVRATEDEGATAFIDYSQVWFNVQAIACFVDHGVTFVGPTSNLDTAALRQFAPYVGTTVAASDRALQVVVDGLEAAGYFDGDAKVGVVRADTPEAQRAVDQVLLPTLERAGYPALHVATMHHTDAGLMANQAANAILQFRSLDVNRVIPVFGFFNMLVFANQAESQNYYPRYGFNDWGGTAGNAGFYLSEDSMRGAVAVSSSPTYMLTADDEEPRDFAGDTDPDAPQVTPGLRRCVEILSQMSEKDYYKTDSGRSAAFPWYCEHFLLWLDAARNVGAGMTPQNWDQGLAGMGGSHRPILVHDTVFGPGRFDGNSSYRYGVWSEVQGCQCYISPRNDWLALP